MIKAMFKIMVICFILVGFSCCLSNKENCTKKDLDFQEGFNKVFVKVIYNYSTIFKDTISTDQVTGLATSVELCFNNDSNKIKIYIGSKEINLNYSIDKYVGIRYNTNIDSVIIITSKTPFIYE